MESRVPIMQKTPVENVPPYVDADIGQDQSRLFFLCPAEKFDDDIRGWVLPHDLEPREDSYAYKALSYVWGDADGPKETLTLLDGATRGALLESSTTMKAAGALQIGENLANALRNLRYEKEYRTLWIDAICINQNDDDSRSRP